MEEYFGRLEIKLSKLLEERGMSRNKLSHKAEMSWNQVESYCANTITRLDTNVLCKLCKVLNCSLNDLLEYIPSESMTPEKKKAESEKRNSV